MNRKLISRILKPVLLLVLCAGLASCEPPQVYGSVGYSSYSGGGYYVPSANSGGAVLTQAMNGGAGTIRAEVVLVSQKEEGDVRWVYLDIGKFGGLAEIVVGAPNYFDDVAEQAEPADLQQGAVQ